MVNLFLNHLEGNHTQQELSDLFAESTIMLDFDHPNVMKLLGVCFDANDNIPLIIMPFMANGDLKSFLTKKRRKHSVISNPSDMKFPPVRIIYVYRKNINQCALIGI